MLHRKRLGKLTLLQLRHNQFPFFPLIGFAVVGVPAVVDEDPDEHPDDKAPVFGAVVVEGGVVVSPPDERDVDTQQLVLL